MRLLLLLLLFCCFSCNIALQNPSSSADISGQSSSPVHTWWLILVSGFSASILFFIWKNLAGYNRIRWRQLWHIIIRQVGNEQHDLGVLALSLAILCWFVSGLFSLVQAPFVQLLATSVCSSLNSGFLLLFLRHLDKEDLPPSFSAYFPTRHTIWTVFIMVVLVTGSLAVCVHTVGLPDFAMLIPDLAFSLYTLYFIGFSFFYLLETRLKSVEIAVLSWVPIVITLLAEVFQLVSSKQNGLSDPVLKMWHETLLFSYKPLLIISYFVLIYSWQLKRINRKEMLPSAKPGRPAPDTVSADVQAGREQYRLLGPKDWMILEALVRGEKTTAIAAAYPADFPNGAKGVDDRIGAIAREFQLSGQSQIKIVVTALKRGLLAYP